MEENNSKKFSTFGSILDILGMVIIILGLVVGVLMLMIAPGAAIENRLAGIIAYSIILGAIVLGVLLKIPGAIIVLLSDIEYNTRRKQIDQ